MEDNRAIPSDMVREQDFILQVRRLHRLGTGSFVLNIMLNALKPEDRGPLEDAQERLKDFAKDSKGSFAEMSNGDIFLVFPDSDPARRLALLNNAGSIALVEEKREFLERLKDTLIKGYALPDEYGPLRERLNDYIEISRSAAILGAEETPEELLNSPGAHGPLTSWSVNQIQNLLEKIQLREFVQKQPVVEHQKDGSWVTLFEENSIGIEGLKQKHFPKLDLSGQNHLFLELCETLDQHLLTELTRDVPSIVGQNISFNLSVHSVMGSVFAQFAHEVPHTEHAHLYFELHRGDLFQNFSATLGAIETLQHEGFKVILDDITLDMLPFLQMGRFKADYIKINVGRLYADQLNDSNILAALKTIPPERVIFFHCDNENALKAGLEGGITKFQGWLMDELLKKG